MEYDSEHKGRFTTALCCGQQFPEFACEMPLVLESLFTVGVVRAHYVSARLYHQRIRRVRCCSC